MFKAWVVTLTLLLLALPFAAGFASDAGAASKNRDEGHVLRRRQREMPTISKDQRRSSHPVRVECGSPLDPNAEPCNDDWDDYGTPPTEVIGGRVCPKLCTAQSCGAKLSDHACRTDSSGTYKYCAEVAFRFCDSYTYQSGLTTCATCLQ
jgi:hypothetical protein